MTNETLEMLAFADDGDWTQDVANAARDAAVSVSNALLEIDHEIDESGGSDAWIDVLVTARLIAESIGDYTSVGDLRMAAAAALDLRSWMGAGLRPQARRDRIESSEGAEAVLVNLETAIWGVARARALEVGVEIPAL